MNKLPSFGTSCVVSHWIIIFRSLSFPCSVFNFSKVNPQYEDCSDVASCATVMIPTHMLMASFPILMMSKCASLNPILLISRKSSNISMLLWLSALAWMQFCSGSKGISLSDPEVYGFWQLETFVPVFSDLTVLSLNLHLMNMDAFLSFLVLELFICFVTTSTIAIRNASR